MACLSERSHCPCRADPGTPCWHYAGKKEKECCILTGLLPHPSKFACGPYLCLPACSTMRRLRAALQRSWGFSYLLAFRAKRVRFLSSVTSRKQWVLNCPSGWAPKLPERLGPKWLQTPQRNPLSRRGSLPPMKQAARYQARWRSG